MVGHQFAKKAAIAGILCALSLACTGTLTRQSNSTTANANNVSPTIIYSELIFPVNSDYLIIPVGVYLDTNNSKGLLSTDFSRSSDYSRDAALAVYNLIFHQRRTGESHLLLNPNSLIAGFHPIDEENEKGEPIKNKAIFLEVIPEDTNKDGNRDRNDATIGYLADPSGKTLKQITPNNTKIVNWQIDKPLNIMLLKVMQNSNNDSEFTGADDTSFIRVNLNNPGIGSDIITPAMREQIDRRITP